MIPSPRLSHDDQSAHSMIAQSHYCFGSFQTCTDSLRPFLPAPPLTSSSLESSTLAHLALSVIMSFTVFYTKNGVERPIKMSILDAFRGVPDMKPRKPKSVSSDLHSNPKQSFYIACEPLTGWQCSNDISAPAAEMSIRSTETRTRRRAAKSPKTMT